MAALIAPGLAAAHGRGGIAPAAFQPSVTAAGVFAPDTRGTWSAPGLGYLFAIGADGVEVYNQSGKLCWRDPFQSGPVSPGDQGPFSYFARPRGPFDIAFSASTENSFHLYADRSGRLPTRCLRKEDRTKPLYVFDAIATTLIEFYPFSARRHVDWAARQARLRPRAAAARTDAELKSVLQDFLADFEDAHTAILGPGFQLGRAAKPTMERLAARYARGEAPLPNMPAGGAYATFTDWYVDWRSGQQAATYALLDPATRQQKLVGGAVTWGVLPGNVGYLAIERMGDYEEGASLARDRELIGDTLDEALGALQGTQALLLDVVDNSGGHGEVALDIASRFADRRRLALTLELPGVRRRAPQGYHIAPAQGRVRYAKPVYLLTSEATTSAGEWLALAMRTLPQATLVGEATQGAFTGDFNKGLPNGWMFTTSVAIGRDAYGVNYETRGVPPDIDVEVYPAAPTASDADFDLGRVRAVSALAQAIATDGAAP